MSNTKKPCAITLLDGGLGTTLSLPPYNITFTPAEPLWSSHLLISSPETLLAAQKSFVKAGAEVVITGTYQCSYEGFAATDPIFGKGKKEVVEKMMRSAVKIAREAFDNEQETNMSEGERGRRKGKVALSLGAYGAIMIPSQEYSGLYDSDHQSVDDLKDWHFERLSVFLPFLHTRPQFFNDDEAVKDQFAQDSKECWENIDMVAFETIPVLNEIIAARRTMWLELPPATERFQKPFWISCVFPGEDNRLPDGSSVRKVVRAMLGEQEYGARPMGIGMNCTHVGKVEGLVREFEDAVLELEEQGGEEKEKVALVIYPDGTRVGESYNTTTQQWEISDEVTIKSQKSWDERVFEIVQGAQERGVWSHIFVGGCCRTGPGEIGKLRKRIDARA